MDSYWNKKTFCLITGASRGIGRCISIEFGKKVGPGSILLLVARSRQGLEKARDEILSIRQNIKVSIASLDLGKPNSAEYRSIIQKSLSENGASSSDFEHSIIVQNAASLGIENGLKVAEMDDLAEISDYYSFNLNSFIMLNTSFFKIFDETDTSKQLRSVVHISSLGAVEPFKTWGLYCASKAARDMLLKSMALESGIHALNWAPGCVDTDIYEEAVKFTADEDLKKAFDEDRKAGKILTPEQTVTRMMKVLAGQKYVKGEHVAYGDFD